MRNEPPSGEFLLSLLINLLADQEGVKITYELEQKGTVDHAV